MDAVKVRRALLWLKENNEFYVDVEVDEGAFDSIELMVDGERSNADHPPSDGNQSDLDAGSDSRPSDASLAADDDREQARAAQAIANEQVRMAAVLDESEPTEEDGTPRVDVEWTNPSQVT